MTEITNMWSIISRMGSVESKFKGGYHTTSFNTLLEGVGTIGPINHDKQFPNFKSSLNPSILCHHNYRMDQQIQINSSPQSQEPVTKSNPMPNIQLCNNKKKKRKRRRRKKKGKNNQIQKPVICVETETVIENCNSYRRQRQLSTTSEDSFIICFDDNCEVADQISELSENETETIEDIDSSDSAIAHKKVRFADDSELCEIHPMVMWSYAYQAARKGPWEEYARDRDRFHKRVINIEADISHVFSPEHRARIYKERFAS